MENYLKVEYEARFLNVRLAEVRQQLLSLGAIQKKPKTLMRREIFSHPGVKTNGWLRLRDEGDKITLCFKTVESQRRALDSVREAEVEVADYSRSRDLLLAMGYEQMRYQENFREEYLHDGVLYSLDTWPLLATFLEVEGGDDSSVRLGAKRLQLDLDSAHFGSVDEVYKSELGMDILALSHLTFEKQQ